MAIRGYFKGPSLYTKYCLFHRSSLATYLGEVYPSLGHDEFRLANIGNFQQRWISVENGRLVKKKKTENSSTCSLLIGFSLYRSAINETIPTSLGRITGRMIFGNSCSSIHSFASLST